jgi:hypothetical protein
MDVATFHAVTLDTLLEVVEYTFEPGMIGRVGAAIAAGAAFGDSAETFLRKPFVQKLLPMAQELGVIDEKREVINIDALSAGINICTQRDYEINLDSVIGPTLNKILGKIKKKKKDFGLWAAKLKEAENVSDKRAA